MSNFYPRVKPPALAQKCDDKRSVEQYLKTIDWDVWFQEIIKLDSSPGYPYTILGKTNKGILSDYRQVIIDLTIDRFIRLIGISLGELQDMNYRDLLDNNLVDPVRLFVKQEPHPSRKFLTGKMRLISSVSIVDQLVERLFHSYINNKFIEQWVNIPSKPGIGLTTDADFSCIIDQFNLIKNPCSSDISGWDWSVQYDELMFIADFRALIYGLPFDHPFIKGMRNRQHLVAASIYGLSDGTLFVSDDEKGIQLSGCYITSAGNSEIRIANTILAQAISLIRDGLVHTPDFDATAYAVQTFKQNPRKWLSQIPSLTSMAMGDDCLEEYTPYLQEIYEYLGHPVKFVDVFNQFEDMSFEFCSHRIEMDNNFGYFRHYPSNVGKSLFNLLHQPASRRTVEILDTFLLSIRHHPDRAEIIDYLYTTEWEEQLNVLYPLSITQSCLSEMTRKGSKKKVIVDSLGNQEIIITKKKSTTAHPPQKDSTVVEYVTPIARHLKLGKTKTTKIVHKDADHFGSGVNPISRSVEYGRESFKMTGIHNGVRIQGRSIVSQLVTHPSSTLAQLNTCIVMHPSAMNSVQLDQVSQLYQKYKFKRFDFEVIPQMPTTSTGMIFGAIYPSNDIVPPLENINLKKYLQANPSFKEVNVYKSLRLKMPGSRYLPSYTMEFGSSDTSIQGVAYFGSQFATGNTYIADIIVTYDIELYNMTAPSIPSSAPTLVTITFSSGNYTSMEKSENVTPYHPAGIYQMVCALDQTFGGQITLNGTTLSPNSQVLWYVVQQISAGVWKHSWAYSYDAAVAGNFIKFPSLVAITTGANLPMRGNIVRRFTTGNMQPFNYSYDFGKTLDLVAQSEQQAVQEHGITAFACPVEDKERAQFDTMSARVSDNIVSQFNETRERIAILKSELEKLQTV